MDARSDLYSTGVVMYEMLTSRLPFVGDSPVAVAIQHINAVPLMPREINPDIPLGMEEICMHAMEANLNRRYSSAEEMLSDLEEFRKNPAVVFGYGAMGKLDGSVDGVSDDTEIVPTPLPVKKEPSAPIKTPAHKAAEMTASEYRRNRRKAGRTGVMVGVVIVLLFAVLLFTFMWKFFLKDIFNPTTEMMEIPSFVGKTYSAVQNDPEYKDVFEFDVDYVVDDSVAVGKIVEQSPKAGTQHAVTESGIRISLKVASEEEAEELMPDLSNLDYREATNLIGKLNSLIKVETRMEYSDTVAENLVISQIPAKNEPIYDGTTIYITYSLGPEQKTTTVPEVTGISMTSAIKRLQSKNLLYKVTYEDSDQPVDQVLYQNYEPGEEVPEYTEITLSCSNGALIRNPDTVGPAEPEPAPDDGAAEDAGAQTEEPQG